MRSGRSDSGSAGRESTGRGSGESIVFWELFVVWYGSYVLAYVATICIVWGESMGWVSLIDRQASEDMAATTASVHLRQFESKHTD